MKDDWEHSTSYTPDDHVVLDGRPGTVTATSDDALDGKLGGDVKPPAHGSIADLVARARAAGFSTIADWVDNLEDIVARYEGRRGMVDGAAAKANERYDGVLRALEDR